MCIHRGEYMRFFVLFSIFTLLLYAQKPIITPSDVYSQVDLIKREVNYLLNYYDVKYDSKQIERQARMIKTKMKPRNVWQKSYEVLVKINILRQKYDFPIVEPVNMSPVLHLNPDLVYEQTQRILTELAIFMKRQGIEKPNLVAKTFKNKEPRDVFRGLTAVSLTIDKLNGSSLTPSYVFGENMRIYDDISLILSTLQIDDSTIPPEKNPSATPKETFAAGLLILEKIKQLQILAGIDFVDFSTYQIANPTPSDVFSITQMIIAEVQTLKAYLGISSITPPANRYYSKTPIEVDQLMRWNLRKLELISVLKKNIEDNE